MTTHKMLKGFFVVLLITMSFLLVSANDQSDALSLGDEKTLTQLFEEVSPSVVSIKNAALRWDWFSMDVYKIPRGAGSGFVWDKKGHIITNYHVIAQANKIEVVFEDQKSYVAKVVGVSPDHDLAVIKVDAPEDTLKPIKLAPSKDLKVGQSAICIGNPFGLDHSMTTGIVSALGRSINAITGRKIYDVIQTDAAINPGNSGGPLLDSAGRLMGVATAIYSPSGAYAGVGFAIPSDIVRFVVPQLIDNGRVMRVGLGVHLLPDKARRQIKIEGAMILNVIRNSAADHAGLRGTQMSSNGQIYYGDIIVAIDGTPIRNNEDLILFFEKFKSDGDEVDIKFIRQGKEFGTRARLQRL